VIKLLLVAGGGALGSTARYAVGNWVQGGFGTWFPWGTLFVNVSGSFLIGVVLGLFEHSGLSNEARLFFAVGILGGYTTFSTFSHDTLRLLEAGTFAPALLNSAGQLLAGLSAVYAGMLLSRLL
jgi:fluoride exporter